MAAKNRLRLLRAVRYLRLAQVNMELADEVVAKVPEELRLKITAPLHTAMITLEQSLLEAKAAKC